MTTARKFLIGAVAVALAIAAYAVLDAEYRERFKLTIEIETPQGVKSGSSVIETIVWERPDWGPPEMRGLRTRARGDAVFVDLGSGRNLIGLLAYGPDQDESKIFALKGAALGIDKTVDWKDQAKIAGRGDLPKAYLPVLITFSNLNDPTTARRVDSDALDQTFGPGFKLVRVEIKTTKEPVTFTIDKKLPWWSAPGRPAAAARRAWRAGDVTGVSVESERLFRKD